MADVFHSEGIYHISNPPFLCAVWQGWTSQLKDHPVLIPKLLLRNAYFLMSADAGPVAVFFSIEMKPVNETSEEKVVLWTSQNWRNGAPMLVNSHTSDVRRGISPIGYMYYNYWQTPARKSNDALELKEHVIWSAAWQTRVQRVSC